MKKNKQTSLPKDTALKIVTDLLVNLGFDKTETKITEVDGLLKINIDAGEESGMLIGYRGEGISSLQLVLNLILYRQTGQWQKIALDIGDYWQRRLQQLKLMAGDYVKKVQASGKSEILPYLSSNERRMVHELLAGDETIATESVGEGRERRLVISPKAGNRN